MSWIYSAVAGGAFNLSTTQKSEVQPQLPATIDSVTAAPTAEHNGSEIQTSVSHVAAVHDVAGPSTAAGLSQAISRKPRAASMPLELQSTNTNVGYVYDSQMLLHASPSDHPEAPARIKQIHRTLRENGLLRLMRLIPIRPVRKSEVLLVHSEDHWDKVQYISSKCSIYGKCEGV